MIGTGADKVFCLTDTKALVHNIVKPYCLGFLKYAQAIFSDRNSLIVIFSQLLDDFKQKPSVFQIFGKKSNNAV